MPRAIHPAKKFADFSTPALAKKVKLSQLTGSLAQPNITPFRSFSRS
jgi:hypothetical protein